LWFRVYVFLGSSVHFKAARVMRIRASTRDEITFTCFFNLVVLVGVVHVPVKRSSPCNVLDYPSLNHGGPP
jgi:hypothetical protein